MKKIYLIILFCAVTGISFAQLKIDSNGNTTVKYGNFSQGNDAVLYLGNTSHSIKCIFGYGLTIGTAGMSNFIKLPQYSGHVGIGREPSYTLDVNGPIQAQSTLYTSDIRFKTNVTDLENPINKIKQVQGISYNFISSDSVSQKYNKLSAINKSFGFIAQDFQNIYPELVYEDKQGYLSIDYTSMIPVLLEAIKELESRIETLENDCCNQSENLKSGSVESSETDIKLNEAKLYQNNPNPFSEHTTIRFEIPPTVKNAQLLVCDMNGGLLKTIEVNQRGVGNVKINANEFTAGMYLYTLITDSKEIATKRMILTQ